MDAVRVTLDWLGVASPEPASVTEHVTETVPVCQAEPADGHDTTGFWLSILTPVIGPTVAQFPAPVHTDTELVEALALVAPAAMEAVRITLPWVPD
jgi:hypothetical protein